MDMFLFAFAIAAGFVLGTFCGPIAYQAEMLENQCQASLPRDQKCVMKYVPEIQLKEQK